MVKRKRNISPDSDESLHLQQEEISTGEVGVTDRMVFEVQRLCYIGLTDQKIAEYFGVTPMTMRRWRKKFPNLDRAVKNGREVADAEIANALFEKARGYEMEVEEPRKNDEGTWTIVTYTKRYPPDTKAAIKWLSARQPENWSENKKVDHSHTVTTKNINEINMNGFTKSEKDTLFKALSQQVEGGGENTNDETDEEE